MLRILAKPWELIKALFFLAFPMARAGTTGLSSSAGVWVARGILVITGLAVLSLLNQWEILGLKGWIPYGGIADFGLPLVALCLYAMTWMGWWLYRLISLEVPLVTSEYEDIDHAWSQAVEALNHEGIHLADTPLFLILGGASSGEESLFRAAGLKAQVKQVPRDSAQPLHVTANKEGIWVTCAGASVLGQQLREVAGGSERSSEVSLDSLMDEPSGGLESMAPGEGGTLRIEDFVASFEKARARARTRTPLGSQKSGQALDTEKYTARLRYLCHLIARDRQGLCPLNGILLVFPITTADPGNALAEVCSASRSDLSNAFEVLRMRCPVLVLLSDLDKLPGFTTLIERLPSKQRNNRMGQRFPLVPQLDSAEVSARIKDSVSWIGTTLFSAMVHSLFRIEDPGIEKLEDVVGDNFQLYRFLAAMSKRHERLSQLVKDSIPTLPVEPILFRGCYVAPTRSQSTTEEAFTPGVFRLMIREQDNVAWTAAALRQDARYMWLSRVLKILLICAIGLGMLFILTLIVWKVLSRPTEEIAP